MKDSIPGIKNRGNSLTRLLHKLTLFTLVAMLVIWRLPATSEAAEIGFDATFGFGGKLTISSPFIESAEAVAIQADGKIIAAGFSLEPASAPFKLVRFNTNGTLDTSFGTGGVVTTVVGLGGFGHDVAIASDGKIIMAGDVIGASSFTGDFALVRYNTDGSLDSSFGSGGQVIAHSSGTDESLSSIVIQPDGKIVASGVSTDQATNLVDFALMRFNMDGTPDLSFGNGGKVTTDFLGTLDFLEGLALQPDGKLVAVGTALNTDVPAIFFVLARYNIDGSLDSSLDYDGKLILDDTHGTATDVGVRPNGKIVATSTLSLDFTVLQFNTDGTLDTTFGSGGIASVDVASTIDRATNLAIYPDGRIAVGGASSQFQSLQNQDFGVVRFNADGSVDTTFGSEGRVTTDFSGERENDLIHDLAIQADGKIVAVGQSAFVNPDFALVRYNSDNSFDICIQDDSNGNILKLSSTNGGYIFIRCNGLLLFGTGTLTQRGNVITLQHNTNDRRLQVKLDRGTNKATASIQVSSTGTTFTITDRDIRNNTCSCP